MGSLHEVHRPVTSTESEVNPIVVPLFCGICGLVFLLSSAPFRLPLPLGLEDFFIADSLLQHLPLRVSALQNNQFHRLFTYAFVHGSWWHLILNLFGLWFTGNTLERLLGWRITLKLLLLGSLAGAIGFLLSLLIDPRLPNALTCIGASAILTAYLGAITSFTPRSTITILIFALPIRIKALYLLPLLLILFTLETIYMPFNTAYGAHLGGWCAGLLFGLHLRPLQKAQVGEW